MPDFSTILSYLKDFGIGQGLLVLLVLAMMYFLYRRMEKLHDEAIAGKNQEINRLNDEVKSYREMFLSLLRENLLKRGSASNQDDQKNVG